MERERWLEVYRILRRLDTGPCRGIYRDSVIVAVYFWAVVHDRPTSWACQPENWVQELNFGRLPSQSTISRRLSKPNVQALLEVLEHDPQITGPMDPTLVKVVDGKPLPVGGHSGDPDAKWGHGVRGMVKGYKIFAIWGRGPMPLHWEVGAMNVSEQSAAERMIPRLPDGGGYLLGDKLYDINKLYDAAAAVGYQLVAARKRPDTGLGHRHHSPARLRSIELLRGNFGHQLYQWRGSIERNFGGLTNFGGGLAPLPNWVRRFKRVRLWAQAKLIINALRVNALSPIAVA